MTDKQVSKAAQVICKFKKKYSGILLLFRFGDSYEAFFDDAERCSEVCGLDLTERDVVGELVPLVTIPLWLIERYVKKMTAAGYTVALCEQFASGNTNRDIVRVVSPGGKDKMQQAKMSKRPSSHHRPSLRLVRPAR